MPALLWLFILAILVFFITFIIMAPLKDDNVNLSLQEHECRVPGLFHVTRDDRGRVLVNGSVGGDIHMKRGRTYTFLCDDDTGGGDIVEFHALDERPEEDDDELHGILTKHPTDARMWMCRPTHSTPAHFHYRCPSAAERRRDGSGVVDSGGHVFVFG